MTEQLPRKRPGWVWVISIFFFFSAAWTLLSFYLIHTGTIPLNQQQRAYFEGLGAFDYSVTVLLGVANLMGAACLFLLRRAALYLFGAALVVNTLFTAWQILSTPWPDTIGSSGLTGAFIGWVLLVAVCLYVWRLSRKGVLV